MNYHLTNARNTCTGLAAGGSGSRIGSSGMAQWNKRSARQFTKLMGGVAPK
jgi:hypothetical protein